MKNEIKDYIEKIQQCIKPSLKNKKINYSAVSDLLNKLSNFINTKIIFNEINDATNNIKKLKQLEQIDKDCFGELIKVDNRLNQEVLASLFYNIAKLKSAYAEISQEFVEKSNKYIKAPKYYNDAALFCQYSINIIDNVRNLFKTRGIEIDKFDNLKSKNYKLLEKIYNKLLVYCTTNTEKKPSSQILNKDNIDEIAQKHILSDLRQRTIEKVKAIDDLVNQKYLNVELNEKKKKALNKKIDQQYVDQAEELFKFIAKNMQNYLSIICTIAENYMGEKPCEYTVVGLGSMALSQMTPYSDLEFCIITAEHNYRTYFRNLSYLVQFQNICLNESVIPMNYYLKDLGGYIKQAINFDLGGKTPLGRIDQDKPYELIQTIEKMFKYVKNENNYSEHIDKNLANILEHTCFVYGNEDLLQQYKNKLKKFMCLPHQKYSLITNAEYRAYKALKKGVLEIDYYKDNEKKVIAGDLDRFNPKMKTSIAGGLFDVKEEIYRIFDRLICQIGKLLDLQEDNSWKILKLVNVEGICNKKGFLNLQKNLAFANLLRVKTYIHYQHQREKLFPFKKEGGKDKLMEIFQLSASELKIDGNLFEFYYTVKPLHQKLVIYCNALEKYFKFAQGTFNESQILIADAFTIPKFIDLIKDEIFYDNYIIHKLSICNRLTLWPKIVKIAEKHLDEYKGQSSKVTSVNQFLGTAYFKLHVYEQALQCFLKTVEFYKNLYKKNSLSLAINLNNLAAAYYGLKQYEDSMNSYQKALSIYKNIDHPQISSCLLSYGPV